MASAVFRKPSIVSLRSPNIGLESAGGTLAYLILFILRAGLLLGPPYTIPPLWYVLAMAETTEEADDDCSCMVELRNDDDEEDGDEA